MGEEDYYLELCERPVHFEKANPVNCVFFDEANKQVRPARTLLFRAAAFAQPPLSVPQGCLARQGQVSGKQARALFSRPGAGPAPAPSCWVGGGTRLHRGRGSLQSDSWVDPELAPSTQRILAGVVSY